jgi:DNA repair protein RadC
MHEGHRERMRKRCLKEGFDGFEQHQLLEMILFYIIPRKDTNEIAHELITRFGSYSAVFDAPVEELCKVNGITENGAVLFKLIIAAIKEYQNDKVKDAKIINSTVAAKQYLEPKFFGEKIEKLMVLCLDSSNKAIKCDVVSTGTVSESDVNRRKIAEVILANNAVSIIVAHNHPGGKAEPSKSDVTATKVMAMLTKSLNVKILDHIIFTDKGKSVSMAEIPQYAYIFD